MTNIPHQPFEPKMIHIPNGPFLMGTSDWQIDQLAQAFDLATKWQEKGYFGREQPRHTVTLSDYYIAKHPVTVKEYRAFVDAGGYRLLQYWTDAGWVWRKTNGIVQPDLWDDAKWAGDDRLPVVGVSWYEAYAYCQWLSKATGRNYRLPTEAEWEKAARGTDGRLYPWGNTFDALSCNTRASGLKRTTPVGEYSPLGDSLYRCMDMIGNVSEWTMSQYKPYPYDTNDGRNDPAGDIERVTRGGSWYSLVLRARTASRGMNNPFFTDNDVGFRCALTVMS
ncbi:MAG: formylglycine-generating enzyme family protein [Chloroflexi bacterium]|nr:formylglycine-generating enzyme family protein [Chloroflexota bacterium]